jgi:hypothetical protein
MTFLIEKNLPLPPKKTRANPKHTDFLKSLEIGDSFGVEQKKELYPFYHAAKKINIKLAFRKQEGEKYRIWRIL